MKEELYGFRVDFSIDSGENYLELTGNDKSKSEIIDYQVEMILQNRIPGLASLFLKKKDAEIHFLYRITGLVSLKNYFCRQKIEASKFVAIMENILQVILDSKKYMLSEESFILEESLIFIQPKTGEVSLVYVPVENKNDQVKNLQSVVINLILQTPYIETGDKIIQDLLNLFREEYASIKEVLKNLKDIKNRYLSVVDLNEKYLNIEAIKPKIFTAASENGDSNFRVYSSAKKVKLGKNIGRKIILVFIAILALFAAAISYNSGLKAHLLETSKITESYYIVGMTVVVILIVTYFSFHKKVNNHLPNLINSENNMENSDFVSEFIAAALDDQKDETVILQPSNDETIILEGKIPVLKSVKGNDIILICKKDFIIGRNEEICDYALENKSIGRVHARISKNDDKYYVIDMDSKNGTFLNGQQLASNKPYHINENDKLTFASIEFEFLFQ